jgi:hypothetical protein
MPEEKDEECKESHSEGGDRQVDLVLNKQWLKTLTLTNKLIPVDDKVFPNIFKQFMEEIDISNVQSMLSEFTDSHLKIQFDPQAHQRARDQRAQEREQHGRALPSRVEEQVQNFCSKYGLYFKGNYHGNPINS